MTHLRKHTHVTPRISRQRSFRCSTALLWTSLWSVTYLFGSCLISFRIRSEGVVTYLTNFNLGLRFIYCDVYLSIKLMDF